MSFFCLFSSPVPVYLSCLVLFLGHLKGYDYPSQTLYLLIALPGIVPKSHTWLLALLGGHHSLHHTAIAQIICGIILTVYYWGTFSLLVVAHSCCYSLESQAMLCQRYAQYVQRTRDPKWNDCIGENEAKSYWGQLRDQITSGEREREVSRRITAMRCSDFR